MERTKVIAVNGSSLGFEIGDESVWRGEFTLEQVAEFGIKEGQEITIHMLEMEDVFATVEFSETEKTAVPATKVSERNELFSPKDAEETETSHFSDTLPD
jgi:hypothetical protein